MVKNRTARHEDTIRELHMGDGRLTLGEPLSQFQGVLTGVPTFLGSNKVLQEAAGDR